jgi:hypothetical protein
MTDPNKRTRSMIEDLSHLIVLYSAIAADCNASSELNVVYSKQLCEPTLDIQGNYPSYFFVSTVSWLSKHFGKGPMTK